MIKFRIVETGRAEEALSFLCTKNYDTQFG